MADNVTANPGSGGPVFATDDIGGVNYPRSKVVFGVDGTATDVSATDPLPVTVIGELVEALEAQRMALQALTRTMGLAMPDTAGRLRVLAENATAANLNATAVISSGTVTTVSTVTNQSQAGTFAMQDHIPALMHLQADSLRRNIAVT
jgi:secreted trypsin-like serine protease